MSTSRFPFIDILRGCAIGLMVIYHFFFDLDYYRFIDLDMNQDSFWISFRTIIVTFFLGIMGISFRLASASGIKWRKYSIRLLQIASCAAIISISSYVMFPQSWIFFGILHFVALSSILVLFTLRFHWANLAIGILIILFALNFNHPWFDQPAFQWLGLMTAKPYTEDYVPLLPWLGVVLIGIFVGKQLLYHAPKSLPWCYLEPRIMPARILGKAGRHSLIIYMLHQPFLLGMLFIFDKVFR